MPARQETDSAATNTGPPPLDTLLNLDDIEREATKRLSRKAWAYYYSAADDLHTKRHNNSVFRQVLLRPRIFVDCTKCDLSTSFVSEQLKVPFFVSPAAMARLGHPSGERGIAAACAKFGAAHIISNNASLTPEQIVQGAPREQVFGWQLYVQEDRHKSESMLARIAKLPNFKFVVLTLDAPVPGKREDDERAKHDGSLSADATRMSGDATDRDLVGEGGIGNALSMGVATDLTWQTTLSWLAKHTDLPIVLKGVQTHEDAYLAAKHAPKVRGIVLSNHGGRATDTAPPPLHVLLEIRKFCPEVLKQVDVVLDGGIRRGTDVVKALALGAKAVGLGRAPLWALAVGGEAGVARMLRILADETYTAARLLGVERLADLRPEHVNTAVADRDVFDGPSVLSELALQGGKYPVPGIPKL